MGGTAARAQTARGGTTNVSNDTHCLAIMAAIIKSVSDANEMRQHYEDESHDPDIMTAENAVEEAREIFARASAVARQNW